MHEKILIIEDEEGLLLTLRDRLTSEGFKVSVATDGNLGVGLAKSESFDLIILDIMLPELNGFDVCREIRSRHIATPILFLTARGEVTDKVVGLKLGGDDYLTKPFEMIELLARVEALLRRTREYPVISRREMIRFNNISMDLEKCEVRKNGEIIELSAQEFRLLGYLARHPETVLTRQELLDHVWGYEATPSTRTVDVHIAWLRQKIEVNPHHPNHIITVHKLGYKFIAGA